MGQRCRCYRRPGFLAGAGTMAANEKHPTPERTMSPNPRPDFPFHNGEPVRLEGRQWLLVLLALVAAFTTLLIPVPAWAMPWGRFVPALLFCALPLAALAGVAGRSGVMALFPRWRTSDWGWMVGIVALNLLVTLAIGWALQTVHHASPNPMFNQLAHADTLTRVLAFVAMVPQLLGEELLTMLPLLACLWWLRTRTRLRHGSAIALAWLVSALPFALVHLPTYQWDLVQCLVIIGSARLVLTLAYLATRNLAVSTGAHVLNDWALFATGLMFASSKAGVS
jgi:membrane protease YdiL (CAAX protease family)